MQQQYSPFSKYSRTEVGLSDSERKELKFSLFAQVRGQITGTDSYKKTYQFCLYIIEAAESKLPPIILM